MRPRSRGRPRARRAPARLAGTALALALALLLPGRAATQPRPPNLQHLAPVNVLDLGTHFGELDGTSALAFPLTIQARLGPDVVLLVDGPFGYLNAPGNPAAPVLGNLGAGVRYVGVLGRRHRSARFVWAGTLSGRLPTGPSEDADQPAAPLRWITPYQGERWSPRAAALRGDVSLGSRWQWLALEAEVGATAHLPLDETEATVGLHWGALATARVFRRAWLVLEATGTDVAPGLPDAPRGHLVSVTPGLRLQLGRAQPGFFVSLPVAGPDEAPVVYSVGIAAF